jgi:hypothetical protein
MMAHLPSSCSWAARCSPALGGWQQDSERISANRWRVAGSRRITIGAVSGARPLHGVPGGPVDHRQFPLAMDIVILLGAGLTIALAMDDNRASWSCAGDARPRAARELGHDAARRRDGLMIVFLGIELMSISVYALAGINRRSARGAKARSSTSCSARSRRRSCCTASRSCTAPPAARTSTGSPRRSGRSAHLEPAPAVGWRCW